MPCLLAFIQICSPGLPLVHLYPGTFNISKMEWFLTAKGYPLLPASPTKFATDILMLTFHCLRRRSFWLDATPSTLLGKIPHKIAGKNHFKFDSFQKEIPTWKAWEPIAWRFLGKVRSSWTRKSREGSDKLIVLVKGAAVEGHGGLFRWSCRRRRRVWWSSGERLAQKTFSLSGICRGRIELVRMHCMSRTLRRIE